MPIHIICIYVYTVYRTRQKQTEWNETKNLNNNAFVHLLYLFRTIWYALPVFFSITNFSQRSLSPSCRRLRGL